VRERLVVGRPHAGEQPARMPAVWMKRATQPPIPIDATGTV
jgi:hypothetical protein